MPQADADRYVRKYPTAYVIGRVVRREENDRREKPLRIQ